MINAISETQQQAEFFYNAAVKQLYNLALYTVGNQSSIEQITIDAFVFAFRKVCGRSDADTFIEYGIQYLYRYGKKNHMEYKINCGSNNSEAFEGPVENRKQQLINMLGKLSFNERFLLLLFCRQRYSIKQIAGTMHLPVFIVRKNLFGAIHKAEYYLSVSKRMSIIRDL